MPDLDKYYEYLKSAKADVPPTLDSFKKTLSDEASAKQYYEYLRGAGFDAPETYDSFAGTLGLKKKELSPSVSPSTQSTIQQPLPLGVGTLESMATPLESQGFEQFAGQLGQPKQPVSPIVQKSPTSTPIIEGQPTVTTDPITGQPKFDPGAQQTQEIPQLTAAQTGAEATAKEQAFYDPQLQREGLKLGEKTESLLKGTARLVSSVTKSVPFLYDVAVASATKGDPLLQRVLDEKGLGSAGQLGEKLGIKNLVAEDIDKAIAHSEADLQRKYDKPVTEYLFGDKPDIEKGLNLLANRVLESVPTSLGLLLGSASGMSGLQTGMAGTAVFGGEKMGEIEGAPVDHSKKVINALITGGLETVTEYLPIKQIGKLAEKAFFESGVEAAKKIATEGYKKVYGKMLMKYLGAQGSEVLGEVVNQIGSNVTDKYTGVNPDINIWDNVGEAAVIALGQGGGMTAPVALVDIAKTRIAGKKAMEIQEQKKTLEQDLASENVSESAKPIIAEKIKNLNEEEAKLYEEEKKKFDALPDDKKEEVNTLLAETKKVVDGVTDGTVSEETREILKSELETKEAQIEKIYDEAETKRADEEKALKEREREDEEFLRGFEEELTAEKGKETQVTEEIKEEPIKPITDEKAKETKEAEVLTEEEVQESPEITQTEKTEKDATKEGIIPESNLAERKDGDETRQKSEAGDSDIVVEGGQVEEKVTEEAPAEKVGATEVSDKDLAAEIGEDAFKIVSKQEETLGKETVNRGRVISTAKKIAEKDGSKTLKPEHAAEAAQYEIGYNDDWADLRSTIKKGGMKNNAESVGRMIDVGVTLPEDIVSEYNNFKNKKITTTKVINDGYKAIKEKQGEKKAKKYFDQADRLINPNENEVVEYRSNGIVTKDGDKYTFHALADTDLKNWRIGFTSDVTDQFAKKETKEEFEKRAKEEFEKKVKEGKVFSSKTEASIGIFDNENEIELNSLFVKEQRRGKGKGSEALSELKEYADSQNKPIKVKITDELGGDVKRLKNFYEKNGFVNTEGDNYVYDPSKKTKEKPKKELVDEEEQIDAQKEDDEASVKRLNDDIALLKGFKEEGTATKKFKGLVERAFKMKEEGKISRSTYVKYRNMAQQVLGPKVSVDAEQAKFKIEQLKEEIKKKLLGEGYKKIAMSAPGFGPAQVAHLIDLTAAAAKKAVDAGFAVKEAVERAIAYAKKHPSYQKLIDGGHLKEEEFTKSVTQSFEKAGEDIEQKEPVKKEEKKEMPTGKEKETKTGKRAKANEEKLKDVLATIEKDDFKYESVSKKEISEHIDKQLDEIEKADGIVELARDMIAGNNPFNPKISDVALGKVVFRLQEKAETATNEINKEDLNRLAGKALVQLSKNLNTTATKLSLHEIISKALPLTEAGVTAFVEEKLSSVQDSYHSNENKEDVNSADKQLKEVVLEKEMEDKVRQMVEAELTRIAESMKGKEWTNNAISALDGLKIDLSDC